MSSNYGSHNSGEQLPTVNDPLLVSQQESSDQATDEDSALQKGDYLTKVVNPEELHVSEDQLFNQLCQFMLFVDKKETAIRLIEACFSECAVKIQSIKNLFEKMLLQRNSSDAFDILAKAVAVSGSNWDPVIAFSFKELVTPKPGRADVMHLSVIPKQKDTTLYNRVKEVLKTLNVAEEGQFEEVLDKMTTRQRYTFLCLVFSECQTYYGLQFVQSKSQEIWLRLLSRIRTTFTSRRDIQRHFDTASDRCRWSGCLWGLDPVSALAFSCLLLDNLVSPLGTDSQSMSIDRVSVLDPSMTRVLPLEHFHEVCFAHVLLFCQFANIRPEQVMQMAREYGATGRLTVDNLPEGHFPQVLRDELLRSDMFSETDNVRPDDFGLNWPLKHCNAQSFYRLAWKVYLTEIHKFNNIPTQWGNTRNFLWKLIHDISQRNSGKTRRQWLDRLQESMTGEWLDVYQQAYSIYECTVGLPIPWNKEEFKTLLYETRAEPLDIFIAKLSMLISEPIFKHRKALSSWVEITFDRMVTVSKTGISSSSDVLDERIVPTFEISEVDITEQSKIEDESCINSLEYCASGIFEETRESVLAEETEEKEDSKDTPEFEESLDLEVAELSKNEVEDNIETKFSMLVHAEDVSTAKHVPEGQSSREKSGENKLIQARQDANRHYTVYFRRGAQKIAIYPQLTSKQTMVSSTEFERLASSEDTKAWCRSGGKTSVTRSGNIHELHTVWMTLSFSNKSAQIKVAIAPDEIMPKGIPWLQSAQDCERLRIPLQKDNSQTKMRIPEVERISVTNKWTEIRSWAPPQNREEQRLFIDMIDYQGWHIPGIKELASSIKESFEGVNEDEQSQFTQNHQQLEAFNNVKKHLVNCLVKNTPRTGTQLVIYAKASDKLAVGWFGYEIEDVFYPTNVFSKPFNENQAKWSITKREVAAVVWAIEKFRLQPSATVKLYCEQRVLRMRGAKTGGSTWMIDRQNSLISEDHIELASFDKGQNMLTDHLLGTRRAPPKQSQSKEKTTKRGSKTMNFYESNRNNSREHGRTRASTKASTNRIVLAVSARVANPKATKQESGKNSGKTRGHHQERNQQQGSKKHNKPWKSIGVDITVFESTDDIRYALVIVCLVTGRVTCYPMNNKTATTTAMNLITHFAQYGVPEIIQLDQASENIKQMQVELSQLLERMAPGAQVSTMESNFQTKRTMQGLRQIIDNQLGSQTTKVWWHMVPSAIKSLNESTSSRRGLSPVVAKRGLTQVKHRNNATSSRRELSPVVAKGGLTHVYRVDDMAVLHNNARKKRDTNGFSPYYVHKVNEKGNGLLRTPRGQIREKYVAARRSKPLSNKTTAAFKKNDSMIPEKIVKHSKETEPTAHPEYLIKVRGNSFEDCEWFPVDSPAAVRLAARPNLDREQVGKQALASNQFGQASLRSDRRTCHPVMTQERQ